MSRIWNYRTVWILLLLGGLFVMSQEITNGNPSSPQRNHTSGINIPSLASSSVRVRVGNNAESDVGTGTVIHVTQTQQYQEALVLTCGHIFRPTGGKGNVDVDFFDPNTGKPVTVRGVCVYFDAETDIGFVGVPLPFAVRPVSLVPPEYVPKSGDPAVSVGCSHGDAPSVLEHQIISTDQRYIMLDSDTSPNPSFYYIEVNNAPVQGRSGGGLYVPSDNNNFYLLGVCNAGDPETNDGLFLPASVIYDTLLNNKNLSVVYEDQIRQKNNGNSWNSPPSSEPAPVSANQVLSGAAAGTHSATPIASNIPAQSAPVNSIGFSGPATSGAETEIRSVNFEENRNLNMTAPPPVENGNNRNTFSNITSAAATVHPADNENDQLLNAGFDELRRRQLEGAEIICIVNWPDNSNGPRESEVIRLPKK